MAGHGSLRDLEAILGLDRTDRQRACRGVNSASPAQHLIAGVAAWIYVRHNVASEAAG